MYVVGFGHAYVGSGWYAGGETTLHDLFRTLVEAGHRVEFILSEPRKDGVRGDYIIDGVRVRDYTDNDQPRRIIPRADLVISHLGGAQRASIIAKGAGVPSIHVIHNDADITKVHARHAQYLVYNTHWVLESFRASQSYRPPGMVVRPPVDPAKYETETSRRYITLVNLSDGSGWVSYDKGPKVFYELAKRFPEEEFLGVIGAYGNQDIRTDYPNVTFMEQTGDARDFYSQSKIIISPSGYESYGRISVEAAAAGIPSITSTAPGFLEHQVGYRRVDFRDVDGWEDALRSLLKPRNYSSASKKAKLKSAELWKQSQRELQEFVAECERVARLKQPRRR